MKVTKQQTSSYRFHLCGILEKSKTRDGKHLWALGAGCLEMDLLEQPEEMRCVETEVEMSLHASVTLDSTLKGKMLEALGDA